MKRFFEQAVCRAEYDRWLIELDGRRVRTPGGGDLWAPTGALGDAVAGEWNAQGETVELTSMPLTRMSNAAIDLVPQRRSEVIDQIVRFGETDLLCYRAADPEMLADRQRAVWQPLLDWAKRYYDAELRVTDGVAPVAQPDGSLAALRAALEPMTDFQLAAMSNLTAVLGSVVLALAVRERAATPDAAWEASILDETFQATRWGDDAEAARHRAARRGDLDIAATMLALLEVGDGR